MDPAQPSPPTSPPPPLPPDTAPACAIHPSVRAEQACSRCGAFACRACLRFTPEGLPLCVTCELREGATDLPWDQRQKVGNIAGFVRTCWTILWHPGLTLNRANPQGSVGSSLAFSVLAQIATWLATGLLYSAFAVAMLGVLLFGSKPEEKTLGSTTTVGITVVFILTAVVMVVVLGVGFTLLLSALDHLVLKMVGAQPRPYAVTLRAYALSMAPCLAGVVPVCGIYAVPVWSAIIRVFAYRGLHRISTGKAAVAALLVPGVLLAVVIASYAVIFFMALASGGRNL